VRSVSRPYPTKQSLRLLLLITVLFPLLIPACAPRNSENLQSPVAQTPLPILSSVQIITSTPAPPAGVRIGVSVPAALREQVSGLNIPGFELDVSRLMEPKPGADEYHIQWMYALVAPFPTVRDNVTFDEVRAAWSGTPPAPFDGIPLLMEESTLAALTALWGEPAPGSVRNMPADELLETAWTEGSWAIIPFESLEPKWKVLTIDEQSPIRKNFDPSAYPLLVNYTLRSSDNLQFSNPSTSLRANLQFSNFDPSKLTTVLLTGVTALVRATALTMELKGVTYPGKKIRNLMREADIAHVSNEIPFFTGCRFPKPDQAALVFCSDPNYIDLLTDIGTDVVELTGNHFADYGPRAMLETLEIYKSHGIPYFGGGADLQDSLKPALFEVNGNKIAFVGCNRPDVGRFPTATDVRPGAAPCDFEYLTRKINQLKAEGYVVISTFQWFESYDSYPNPAQVAEFRLMADSGASIVSGSQAHYPQAMEFYGDAFIHYGLGNLFFDQMGDQSWMPPGIRREFLDRYVIYDGRLISVELLTALLEDYSRPRIMTEQERTGFLQEYFYYSGWIPFIPTPTPTITPTLTPMAIPPLPGTLNLIPSTTPSPSP
jgi:hypothetical protein